ncbi:MAG: putative heme iron utilization protein [Pseudohongiellaceae bacterium]|jgi:putative heme iron utilization protein
MTDTIQDEIGVLIGSLKSVQLATLNANQHPEISYAPYLKLADSFFIFISELAAHTQNLKTHSKLSLMFIEDESNSKTVFARKRLILKCQSVLIDSDNEKWSRTLIAFEAAQGPTIQLLKTLPDFCLFELRAETGTFVKGFGQAYKLSGKSLKEIKQIKS